MGAPSGVALFPGIAGNITARNGLVPSVILLYIEAGCKVDYERGDSFEFVQAQLTLVEPKRISHMCEIAFGLLLGTCVRHANAPSLEEREKIGHWAPGSDTPKREVDATCATE